MGLRSAGSYAVAMDTSVAVGFLSCLQFMSLPVLMKEIILCYFYRYGLSFQEMIYDYDLVLDFSTWATLFYSLIVPCKENESSRLMTNVPFHTISMETSEFKILRTNIK